MLTASAAIGFFNRHHAAPEEGIESIST